MFLKTMEYSAVSAEVSENGPWSVFENKLSLQM